MVKFIEIHVKEYASPVRKYDDSDKFEYIPRLLNTSSILNVRDNSISLRPADVVEENWGYWLEVRETYSQLKQMLLGFS